MDLRRSKVKEPTPWIDLAMLGVVAGFFAYSGYQLWNPAPPAAARVAARPPILSRAPAALATPAVVTPEKNTQAFTLPACEVSSAAVQVQTQASLFQVKGRYCKTGESLRGRNETTEETLQVFPRGAEFSTHYFPLLPGRNRIVLESSVRARAPRVLEVERVK